MTAQEFEKIISQDPLLAEPIRRAAKTMPRTKVSLGAPADIAALVVMYPLVKFVISDIGLPWLHEVARYADIWRLKFHKWVDEQYTKHGLDPEAAEAAGIALRKELEKITGEEMKKAWEALAEKLKDKK